VQLGSDTVLWSRRGGLGEGAAGLAGLLLPGVAADYGDARDRLAAGGRRVLEPWRRADGGALARWDHGSRIAGQDGAVDVEAVEGLVAVGCGDRLLDLGEQARQLGPVVSLAGGQRMGEELAGGGYPRRGAACARPGACPCHGCGPSTRPRRGPSVRWRRWPDAADRRRRGG